MTTKIQHLVYAYEVPYLVSWIAESATSLTVTIVLADSDFFGTWAGDLKTLELPKQGIDDLGRAPFIEQMLLQLAPVRPGLFDLALTQHI